MALSITGLIIIGTLVAVLAGIVGIIIMFACKK